MARDILTTTTYTADQLQALCREWQGVMRLQDWDVKVQLTRQKDMGAADAQGRCIWLLEKKMAIVKVLDPVDYPDDLTADQDHELTLVHELLHLMYAPFWTDEGPDHPEHIAMEQAIELTAQALVGLKRQAAG